MKQNFVALLLIAAIVPWASAYITTVESRAESCFTTTQLYRGDSLTVRFQVLTPERSVIDFFVKSPRGNLFHEANRREDGTATFTISEDGQYTVCFRNTGLMESAKTVKFNIDEISARNPQVHPADGTQGGIAEQENLTPLENGINALAAQVRAVMTDQEYFKARERVHRDTTESTNERVMWYSIAEIVLLILITLYQIYALMRFFEVKKSY